MDDRSSIYAYLEKPSLVDYPKRFAAVFFTSGCNFACGFCHNAALMGRRQSGLPWETLETACAGFRKAWVNGAVLTGGEPTCCDDVVDLLRFFRERCGFAVKLDTNGSNPDRLAECLPHVDYVAMDIKTGLSGYPGLVGYAGTNDIQRSIELIKAGANDYEFRTTIIEGVHTDEQMESIRELVQGSRRYALQAFIPREDLPGERYRSLPRTSAARLCALRTRFSPHVGELVLRGA